MKPCIKVYTCFFLNACNYGNNMKPWTEEQYVLIACNYGNVYGTLNWSIICIKLPVIVAMFMKPRSDE